MAIEPVAGPPRPLAAAASPEVASPARPPIDVERLAFFSDAVFAIALTILALDLRLPALPPIGTSEQLVDAIVAMWPQLYSFTLSFVVITLFWNGHYRTFSFLRGIDAVFLLLNLVLLFLIVLLPFPTSVLGEHGDLLAATVFYGCVTGVTALVSTALFSYAWRYGLLGPQVTPAIGHFVTRRALLVPVVLFGAIPLALLSPYLTQVVWLGLLSGQFLFYRGAPPGARAAAREA